MSAAISDRRMLKDQRRQPLIAKVKLLKASSDPEDRAKARRIERNNLHSKKETKKRAAEREQLINYIRRDFKKKLFVKPKQPVKTLVIENLGPMGGQKFGKRMNQRLSAWDRGDIVTALEELCSLYGVELVKVNPRIPLESVLAVDILKRPIVRETSSSARSADWRNMLT